jgi:hypothetical protein
LGTIPYCPKLGNNLVSNAKITHYSKVSENIRLEKAGSKNWWTLVKSLTGSNECSRTIPSIEHNGNLVVDDIEKSELFNKFFCDNDSDMLNNLHSGYFNIGAASRKSRGLIQSGPVALLVSKIFSIYAKITHYSKVSENIRLEQAGSKNWWTLVKSLTGNNECS